MQPLSGGMMAKQDGRRDQIAWWSQAPTGLTLDMLALTGFIPKEVYSKLLIKGVSGSDTIERVFGGQIHFRQPKDKKTKQQLDKVLLLLNRILQVRASAKHEIDDIDNIIQTRWGDNSDLLPSDLPVELRELYEKYGVNKISHPIAHRPQSVFTLIKIREQLQSIYSNPGYFSRIFAVANTLFHEMLLDITTVSIDNMSLHNDSTQYIELDPATKRVMEDAQEGMWGKE